MIEQMAKLKDKNGTLYIFGCTSDQNDDEVIARAIDFYEKPIARLISRRNIRSARN